MINIPGRRLVNIILPRRTKETLFKGYNSVQLLYNSVRYRPFLYKKQTRLSYPRLLVITLTTHCNIQCSICDLREGFKTSHMDFENIFKLENPIRHANTIDLTSWGESILYPKYRDVIEYIFSINKNKKLIAQTTNGCVSHRYASLLKGRLKRFVISLNAATPETYNREMKGGDFDKTIANVKSCLSELTNEDRKVTKLHFVVHANNYKEMPLFVELAKSLNVTQVSFGQFLTSGPDTEQNTLLNIKNEYNDMVKKVEEASKKYGVEVFYRSFGEKLGLTTKNCMFPYEWCIVWINGDMTPCCYLGDYSMGNVFKNNFESVWFGEKMQKLRKSRYLPQCGFCAPFHSFDNLETHCASRYNISKLV